MPEEEHTAPQTPEECLRELGRLVRERRRLVDDLARFARESYLRFGERILARLPDVGVTYDPATDAATITGWPSFEDDGTLLRFLAPIVVGDRWAVPFLLRFFDGLKQHADIEPGAAVLGAARDLRRAAVAGEGLSPEAMATMLLARAEAAEAN
jgi:hypothetical protein